MQSMHVKVSKDDIAFIGVLLGIFTLVLSIVFSNLSVQDSVGGARNVDADKIRSFISSGKLSSQEAMHYRL